MGIKDGNSTFFWHDRWLGNNSLWNRLGENATRTLGLPRNASVSEASNENGWIFRRRRGVEINVVLSEMAELSPPNPTAGHDVALWKHKSDDYKTKFSAAATWNQIRCHKASTTWNSIIWFAYAVPRFGFISWLAILDRLSTGERTRLWGLHQSCLLCGEWNETRNHLFFACPFSFTVWHSVGHRILGRTITPDWDYTIESLLSKRRTMVDKIITRILFQASIYYIWRERNNRCHGTAPRTTSSLVHTISKAVWLRLISRITNVSDDNSTLLQRWAEFKPPFENC